MEKFMSPDGYKFQELFNIRMGSIHRVHRESSITYVADEESQEPLQYIKDECIRYINSSDLVFLYYKNKIIINL